MHLHLHILITACVLVVALIGTCLHRLFLHPLRKHPGPRLAAITDWYASYYVWKGDIHLMLKKWHELHGNIVWFGPNSISFNSSSAMSEIYSARANVRKDDAYSVMSASRHTSSTISCLDKKQHASKRRILAQLFTEATLKGVEERVLSHVTTFCASLHTGRSSEWGRAKNMATWSDFLSFDIISDLCYRKSFNLLESEALRYIPKVISNVSRRNAICFVQSDVWKYKLDRIFLSTVSSQIRDFGLWVKQQAKARAAAGKNGSSHDFFDHLSTARDSETQDTLSQKEVWVELLQLVIAGSDTTAVAISAAFFRLLRNPDALSRAAAEVLAAFDAVDEIRPGTLLRSCKFLHACINETLRLSPPVTGLAPRKVLPGGISIDGVYLPEGTVVGSPIYSLHRNKKYFQDPESFLPERWLVSLDVRGLPFCPFSVGPRACVAKKLAMDEIAITVARVLCLYKMRLDKESMG